MSRTAFSNKFRELEEESPMNYPADWRINLAKLRITNGDKVDLDFSERLEYQSELAFRRVLRR